MRAWLGVLSHRPRAERQYFPSTLNAIARGVSPHWLSEIPYFGPLTHSPNSTGRQLIADSVFYPQFLPRTTDFPAETTFSAKILPVRANRPGTYNGQIGGGRRTAHS